MPKCPRIKGLAPLLGVALALVSAPAGSDPGEPKSAEWLVRTPFYEGVPAELARGVTADEAARLEAWLFDSEEIAIHAAILEVLGLAGHPGAFEAIEGYAANLGPGALGPDAFRACLAIPIGLGHLADRDPRALASLWELAREPRVNARSRHLDRAGLASLVSEMAVAALGQSANPAAGSLLRALESQGVQAAAARAALALREARREAGRR